MPCHVPACPNTPGPSGFCALHQARLNARARWLLPHMTDADKVAIAAHPGWRRKWRMEPQLWEAGVFFYVLPNDGDEGPRFRTAAEALAELDRRNGVTPAAEVARLEGKVTRLEAEVGAERRDNRDMWCALDTIQGVTAGRFPPPATSTEEPTIGSVAIDKVARLRRRLDEVEAELAAVRAHRDTLEDRRRELAADNDVLANEVHLLRFANAYMRNSVETYHKRLEVYSAALDRQSTTIAGLTSDLADRERDITYACADRDEYMRERDEVRAALALARRPWWRKVWAWVTGGAE